MKIKNIVLVLVAALLVLLHPGTVEAETSSDYTYNCGYCNGDYLNYYSASIDSPYVWCAISHLIDNGALINCNFLKFGLSASEDKFYTVKVIGDDALYYGYIRLSEDDSFEMYDVDGGVVAKPLSDFTDSEYGGLSNGLYYGYWFYLASWNPWYEDYNKGCNFMIEAGGYTDRNTKMKNLVKFLTGELTELPAGVTELESLPVYDLEAPLNVSVNGIDNNIFETKSKSVKIRWEQSNIDLTGYKTVFYMRESGRCRKTIFNEWQDVKTPWLFDKDYVTAKYCNNNLKYHEYKWWTDQSKLGDYANAALYGEEIGGLMCEHAAVDFMIRNEKEDADGTLHYSSWVYVNCFEDGTYQIYEMNEDYTLDKDPDETGNINTDSTIYDDETVYDEDDVDASLGIGDAKDFVGGMTDLINSLRSFPALFSKIFSFFPSWVLGMIGMLFIAVLLSRLFL